MNDAPGAIRKVPAGIRTTLGTRKERKAPADADILRDMLRSIEGDDLRHICYRTVLANCVGGWGIAAEGRRFSIGRSKTVNLAKAWVPRFSQAHRFGRKRYCSIGCRWLDTSKDRCFGA